MLIVSAVEAPKQMKEVQSVQAQSLFLLDDQEQLDGERHCDGAIRCDDDQCTVMESLLTFGRWTNDDVMWNKDYELNALKLRC